MPRSPLAALLIVLLALVGALSAWLGAHPGAVRAARSVEAQPVSRPVAESDVLLEPVCALPRRSAPASARGTTGSDAHAPGRTTVVGRVVSDRPDLYGVTTGRATLGRVPPAAGPPPIPGGRGDPVRIASFDGEGRFEFPGVTPGMWMLRAGADEFGVITREIVVTDSDEVLEVELRATPSFRMRLTVSLEQPDGSDLFELPPGSARARARAIVPAFLDQCPAIGVPLPEGARRLTQFSRNVVGKRPGSWLVTTFPEPTRGWLCAVLDDHVLEAAPFHPGLDRIRMRIDPRAVERVPVVPGRVIHGHGSCLLTTPSATR